MANHLLECVNERLRNTLKISEAKAQMIIVELLKRGILTENPERGTNYNVTLLGSRFIANFEDLEISPNGSIYISTSFQVFS